MIDPRFARGSTPFREIMHSGDTNFLTLELSYSYSYTFALPIHPKFIKESLRSRIFEVRDLLYAARSRIYRSMVVLGGMKTAKGEFFFNRYTFTSIEFCGIDELTGYDKEI